MRNAELYADEWAALSTERKKEIIESLLVDVALPFVFSGMETFSLNGITTETAVLNYAGRSFVFVPGRKQAVLGWDSGIEGLEESALEIIAFSFESVLNPLNWWKKQLALAADAKDDVNLSYFEERVTELEHYPPAEPNDEMKAFYSFSGLEKYIEENTSPVRIVDLQPMIIERELNEVGLVHLGQVNRRTNEHQVPPDDLDHVKDYLFTFDTEAATIDYSGRCRFERTEEDPDLYDVYIHKHSTDKDLIRQLYAEGFTLPTEDQWEYLCGAGLRMLFPFGNRFDEDWRYAYMSEENILEKPNMFGLSIAYDPYKYEMVNAPCQVKGGDGGAALCGGEPLFYTMLPLSTYWREPRTDMALEDEDLANGFYFYRRVLVIE